MIWVLKGPGPEMPERIAAAMQAGAKYRIPEGKNTAEEADYIARKSKREDVVYVATSAYHVPRASRLLRNAFQKHGIKAVLHVWGTGTVTNQDVDAEERHAPINVTSLATYPSWMVATATATP